MADEGAQAATVQRAIRPEAISLALFALVLAVTTLLIVGQAAVRQLGAAAAGHPTLAALGMTRAQLTAAGLVEVGTAGAVGAVAAVAVAVAASPLMPIGLARLAEPDPGISVAGTVLATGAVAIVVLLLAWTAWPAWRLASARAAGPGNAPWRAGSHSRLAASLASAGAPVTVTTGARFALDPGAGRAAVPVRSALAGTTLSVLAVTAAFTFGASLLQLVHTPARYGQAWDAAIDLQFGAITPAQARHLLGREPGGHRLVVRRPRDHRDRRHPGTGHRGGPRPGAAALAHAAPGPPATDRAPDRPRHLDPAPPRACRWGTRSP